MEGHVVFYTRFVSLEKLVKFISAADIYITPYLNENQRAESTLAFIQALLELNLAENALSSMEKQLL